MYMKQGNSTDHLPVAESWDFVTTFFTFDKDVGNEMKPFSVSTVQLGGKGGAKRIIQKGIYNPRNNQVLKYNFWAALEWQPGLEVCNFLNIYII